MLTIIQNDPEVPLGSFSEPLVAASVPFVIVHPYQGDPLPAVAQSSAVIVLGGAMGVHDTDRHPFLVAVKKFIQQALSEDIPFLGICLGGQLLADVSGGKVTSGACGEKGTMTVSLSREGKDDLLFAGVPEEFVTFQWHNDSFSTPLGGVTLAASPDCPVQAFRTGTNAYGLQFHPEVTRSIVKCWALWSPMTAPAADEFLAGFVAREVQYLDTSLALFRNFLKIARLIDPPSH